MNVFTASGNLGRDPETKSVGQHTVTEFSIGVKSGFGDKATTFWVKCVMWNKANVAQYLSKGSRVVVSGELSNREFEKKDGGKGYSLELRVNDLDLPPKSQNGAQSNQDRVNTAIDEVPF